MSTPHHIPRIAAGLALAAATAVVLFGSGASAQGGRTITFTELEKGATFKHVRHTKPKSDQQNSLGDSFVFTNPLADASGKVIGRNHAICSTTVGARNFNKSVVTCAGAAVLRDGTLTWQGAFKVGADGDTSAVTGGTGAYANASGVIVSRDAKGGTRTTITLEG
jgi:hypothetical protein